jgi:hypothetical protein
MHRGKCSEATARPPNQEIDIRISFLILPPSNYLYYCRLKLWDPDFEKWPRNSAEELHATIWAVYSNQIGFKS